MSFTTDSAREKRVRSLPARRLPVGVEVVVPHMVNTRIWAPAAQEVSLVIDGRDVPLSAETGGYFSGQTEGKAGSRYGFRVNRSERLYPDPASRFQPDGPHGLSEVVDPGAFAWSD